jgi:hypothetical protein
MTPQELFNQLLTTLSGGTNLVQFAALVLILTQFAKPIISFVYKATTGKVLVIDGDSARYLALLVQVIVWLLYWFATQRGQIQQFTDFATALQGILNSIAPLLPAAVVANLGSSAAYDFLNKQAVPGFHTPTQQS